MQNSSAQFTHTHTHTNDKEELCICTAVGTQMLARSYLLKEIERFDWLFVGKSIYGYVWRLTVLIGYLLRSDGQVISYHTLEIDGNRLATTPLRSTVID
jgi:hypothetical protein